MYCIICLMIINIQGSFLFHYLFSLVMNEFLNILHVYLLDDLLEMELFEDLAYFVKIISFFFILRLYTFLHMLLILIFYVKSLNVIEPF